MTQLLFLQQVSRGLYTVVLKITLLQIIFCAVNVNKYIIRLHVFAKRLVRHQCLRPYQDVSAVSYLVTDKRTRVGKRAKGQIPGTEQKNRCASVFNTLAGKQ